MPFDSRSLISLSNIHQQNGAPAEKPKGVSVYYLRTHFLSDIERAGKSRDSKLSEVEDITSDEHGPIRSKTAYTLCPRDGQPGAAYVDCLSDHPDHVGLADFMFSSSLECKVGDLIDELVSLCHTNHLDEKRTYAWIWSLCHNHHRAGLHVDKKAGSSDTELVELMDALDIRYKAFGPDHEATAMYHSNVGGIYKATGDHGGALLEHERALNIRLKALGPYHPDIAESHIDIGFTYFSKGDYDKALIEFQKVLDFSLKKHGPGHPSTAASYSSIGGIYYHMGDNDRAFIEFQKARVPNPMAQYPTNRPAFEPTAPGKAEPSMPRTYPPPLSDWTKADDARLSKILEKFEKPEMKDWAVIAKEFGQSRTAKQCYERWIRNLKPGVSKVQWQDHEDAIIIDAVTTCKEQPFTRWSDLAQKLPGRVEKQVHDRWVDHLNPNINHNSFTKEDDMKLWEGHMQFGKRWVDISRKFFKSSRSAKHLKNRWYSASFKKFVTAEYGLDNVLCGKKTDELKMLKERLMIANAKLKMLKMPSGNLMMPSGNLMMPSRNLMMPSEQLREQLMIASEKLKMTSGNLKMSSEQLKMASEQLKIASAKLKMTSAKLKKKGKK